MNSSMHRRDLMGLAAGALASQVSAASPIPIIDTHIHLFDPTRPQGVPWPPKDDRVLYKSALPRRFENIAGPFGVVGAIEIEASPWLEDNQWVLDIAAAHPVIVGTIGNLEPGKPEFRKQLERFQRNKLFRGIRYGNLWGRDLAERLKEPEFVADLKVLAREDLVLDTANPDPALIEAVLDLTDRVPELRVVVDHLPSLVLPRDAVLRRRYESNLRRLGERAQVYVKVSEVLRATSREKVLDELWDVFGENRLVYGSDWPNSDHWGDYPQVFEAVRGYFDRKGRVAAEKYFWRNSISAYRWTKRSPLQPAIAGLSEP